jgi:hypothetical protein
MRQQGKRLLFVTNNSSKSRAQYVKKFQSLGMQVNGSEVRSSSSSSSSSSSRSAACSSTEQVSLTRQPLHKHSYSHCASCINCTLKGTIFL